MSLKSTSNRHLTIHTLVPIAHTYSMSEFNRIKLKIHILLACELQQINGINSLQTLERFFVKIKRIMEPYLSLYLSFSVTHSLSQSFAMTICSVRGAFIHFSFEWDARNNALKCLSRNNNGEMNKIHIYVCVVLCCGVDRDVYIANRVRKVHRGKESEVSVMDVHSIFYELTSSDRIYINRR